MTASRPLVPRAVPLEGQDNFRDLGGYPTSDGRGVRWGRVYRSGELTSLHERDIEVLATIGIRTVVDLRGVDEAASRGPDRVPPGAALVSIPIEPGDLSPVLGPAFTAGDLSLVPGDLLHRVSRTYLRDSGPELASLLRLVAEPGRTPLVFHCTQGKDRAGIAAAVLLSALGVPWDVVMEDYLLSNVCRHEQAVASLEALRDAAARQRGVHRDDVDAANVRGLFFVDPSYLEAARHDVVGRYGSLEAFLRDGLGLTDLEHQALRDALLDDGEALSGSGQDRVVQ